MNGAAMQHATRERDQAQTTGIFLKDSAVVAGLGCVGKNNLATTPEYEPRIRWRASLMDRTAQATGPVDYDPCDGRPQPCRRACPVTAFGHAAYSALNWDSRSRRASTGPTTG